MEEQAIYDVLLESGGPEIPFTPEVQQVADTRLPGFRCPSSTMEDFDPNAPNGTLVFGTSNYRGCRGIRDNALNDLSREVSYWGGQLLGRSATDQVPDWCLLPGLV